MAEHLTDIFPNPDILISMAPEDLAPVVLGLARDTLQNGRVHSQQILAQINGPNSDYSKGYAQDKKQHAENALNAAWNWLLRHGLIIPESGINGNSGFCQISAEAAKIASKSDFESFKQAAAFPKAILHPKIADAVWLELARGENDTAVFKALKAVEESVRAAGKYSATDIGIDLMRRAFDPKNGPLRDDQKPLPEREALAHLFAGTIGYYKNPQSHRSVNMNFTAAREVAVLASHLLRIVDDRVQIAKP